MFAAKICPTVGADRIGNINSDSIGSIGSIAIGPSDRRRMSDSGPTLTPRAPGPGPGPGPAHTVTAGSCAIYAKCVLPPSCMFESAATVLLDHDLK